MSSWSRTSLCTFVSLMLAALALNIVMVGPYLLAILMGALLTLISDPIFRFLRRKNLPPRTSASIVVAIVTIVIVVPVSLFFIQAAKEALAFGKSISENPDFSYSKILGKVGGWKIITAVVGDTEALQQKVGEAIQRGVEAASTQLLALLGAMPEAGLQLALAMITTWFLLLDGKRFLHWARGLIPLDPEIKDRIVKSVRFTAISTIWATLAAAVVQAVIMGVGFFALGVGQEFLAAGATFVFAWIPILGSTPVWLGGAIYLYFQGSLLKALLMILVGCFCGVADNFVRPLVLKGQSDMHPLVGLISIVGGIQLFGIWGVFVGPVVTALLISLLQLWPRVARHFGLFAPSALITQEFVGQPGSISPTIKE